MKICGIDEAGRGPVIGPMVMCGLCVEDKDEVKLQNLGVRDSKLLSAAVRERLFRNLTKHFTYRVIVVEPVDIDAALRIGDVSTVNYIDKGVVNYLSEHYSSFTSKIPVILRYIDDDGNIELDHQGVIETTVKFNSEGG